MMKKRNGHKNGQKRGENRSKTADNRESANIYRFKFSVSLAFITPCPILYIFIYTTKRTIRKYSDIVSTVLREYLRYRNEKESDNRAGHCFYSI